MVWFYFKSIYKSRKNVANNALATAIDEKKHFPESGKCFT